MEIEAPNNTTLTLSWQPPVSPNGEILYYIVEVSLLSNGEMIEEENISANTHTLSDLSKQLSSYSKHFNS